MFNFHIKKKGGLAMRIKVIMSSFVLLMSVLVFSLGAQASNPCSTSGSSNCFNGFASDFGPGGASGVTSVYADIYTPNTYPVVKSPSDSAAWPMAYNSATGAYAQVGWISEQGMSDLQGNARPNGVHYFYEIYYGGPNNTDFQVYNTYGPAPGSTHGYRIALENGYWNGYEDNALISSYPTSFYTLNQSYYLLYANVAEYYEELAGNPATNAAYAGTSSNHAKFSNMRAFFNGTTYYSPHISWSNSDYSAKSDYSKYTEGVSTSTIDFWDSRY